MSVCEGRQWVYLAPAGPLAKCSSHFVWCRASHQLILHIHAPPPLAPHLHAQSIVLCQGMGGKITYVPCTLSYDHFSYLVNQLETKGNNTQVTVAVYCETTWFDSCAVCGCCKCPAAFAATTSSTRMKLLGTCIFETHGYAAGRHT